MTAQAFVALLVLVVSVIFWGPLRRLRTATGPAHLLTTGHAYLVLGVLAGLALGPARGRSLLLDLEPVVAFVSGWIGFAVGVQFEWRVLRTVPPRALRRAIVPIAISAAAALLVGLAVLWAWGVPRLERWAAAFVLAAAGAGVAPTLSAIARGRRAGALRRARATLQTIELSAGLGNLVVVLLAAVAFAAFRPVAESLGATALIALNLGIGVLLGLLTYLLLCGPAGDDERLLLGLAMLAFTAGVAGYLLLSPAAMAAMAGVVLVNLPGDRAALLIGAIRKVERPALVILMVVAGVHLASALAALTVVLATALLAARAGAHVLSAHLTTSEPDGPARGWPLGLAPVGHLGLVVALSLLHIWRDATSLAVVGAIAMAALAAELLAPRLLWRALRDAPGEEQAR